MFFTAVDVFARAEHNDTVSDGAASNHQIEF